MRQVGAFKWSKEESEREHAFERGSLWAYILEPIGSFYLVLSSYSLVPLFPSFKQTCPFLENDGGTKFRDLEWSYSISQTLKKDYFHASTLMQIKENLQDNLVPIQL